MKEKSFIKKTGPYAYTAPALLVFAVFLFYPFFKTIYLSLFKTNKMGPSCLWDLGIIRTCSGPGRFLTA